MQLDTNFDSLCNNTEKKDREKLIERKEKFNNCIYLKFILSRNGYLAQFPYKNWNASNVFIWFFDFLLTWTEYVEFRPEKKIKVFISLKNKHTILEKHFNE